ncbi:DcrB-related protein [Acetobacteraceae bacterium KSS8]|uniref:DcrB-related protein n=1 Tax=Endosaccharibacter trunci TaxID=2812733 RepID=A0ABT1W9C9_9PROT|nr:DcrB-related protein [Acetobacteraceae bacterium KSS8]
MDTTLSMTNDNQGLYRLHEGDLALSVPEPWEDQSVNVLRLPGDGHAVASLIVSRDNLPVGLTVAAYTERELKRLAKELPAFELKARIAVAWPDGKGEALLTRWKAASGQMDQITACRIAYGRRLLIFTATHASPMPNGIYNTFIAAISGFRPSPESRGPTPLDAASV